MRNPNCGSQAVRFTTGRRALRILVLTCSLSLIVAGASGTTCTNPCPPDVPSPRENTLLAVTEAIAPVLANLAAKFSITSAGPLALDDHEKLKEAVAGVSAVIADALELGPDSTALLPIFRAALETDTPIVLDNIKLNPAAAALMAKVLGIGLASPIPSAQADNVDLTLSPEGETLTVLAEPSNQGKSIHITILGLSSTMQFTSEVPEEPDDDVDDVHDLLEPGELPAEPEFSLTDPLARAEMIFQALTTQTARRRLLDEKLQTLQQSSNPDQVAHKAWTLDVPAYTWKKGAFNQSGSIEVDFLIELYDSVAHPPALDAKYLRITALGPGAQPGNLKWDDSLHRGYYQDRVEIECGPIGPGGDYMLPDPTNWSVQKTSPPNANEVAQVTSQTGFEVGFDGSASGSFNASRSVTTTLSDFEVVNDSKPTFGKGRWVFSMTSIGSDQVFDGESPYDVDNLRKVDVKGLNGLRTLPTLAKKLFQPNCQIVYRAPGDFQGQVPFRFRTIHWVQELSLKQIPLTGFFKLNHQREKNWRTDEFVVDFSAVNDFEPTEPTEPTCDTVLFDPTNAIAAASSSE